MLNSNKFQLVGNRYEQIYQFSKNVRKNLPEFNLYLIDNLDNSIQNRLIQILLSYIELYFKQNLGNPDKLVPNNFSLKGKVSFLNYKISVSFMHWLECIIKYNLLSAYIYFRFLKSRFSQIFLKKNSVNDGHALLFGGPRDLNVKIIYEFVQASPLIFNSEIPLITQTAKLQAYKNIDVAKYPLLKLLEKSRFSFFECINFSLTHFLNILLSNFKFISSPITALLASDLPWMSVAKLLNERRSICEVYITNTYYINQPLWMTSLKNKRFRLSFIWYSVNCNGLYWIEKNGEKYIPMFPAYYCLNIDHSFYWFEGHKKVFENILFKKPSSTIVGPTLFYKNTIKDTPEKKNDLIITIFDVTALSMAWAEDNNIPENYYSHIVVKKFLDDIKSIAERLQTSLDRTVILRLKHKREYAPIHDNEYIDYVSSIIESGKVELIDINDNIYEVVGGSDIVISLPFTSTAYIADSMDVTSIFYDPTNILIDNLYYHSENLFFIQNKDELFETVYQSLKRD